jgi:hypothetical protein
LVTVLYLEILSLVPTGYSQCSHCETMFRQSGIGDQVRQEIMKEYPADMLEEHIRLSDWVVELVQRYGPDIRIRVIDPQSGLGLWKSLRHWVRKYPTFIINGREKYSGWDQGSLDAVIQKATAGQPGPERGRSDY